MQQTDLGRKDCKIAQGLDLDYVASELWFETPNLSFALV